MENRDILLKKDALDIISYAIKKQTLIFRP